MGERGGGSPRHRRSRRVPGGWAFLLGVERAQWPAGVRASPRGVVWGLCPPGLRAPPGCHLLGGGLCSAGPDARRVGPSVPEERGVRHVCWAGRWVALCCIMSFVSMSVEGSLAQHSCCPSLALWELTTRLLKPLCSYQQF